MDEEEYKKLMRLTMWIFLTSKCVMNFSLVLGLLISALGNIVNLRSTFILRDRSVIIITIVFTVLDLLTFANYFINHR